MCITMALTPTHFSVAVLPTNAWVTQSVRCNTAMEEINLFEIPIYRSNGEDIERSYARRLEAQKKISDFSGVKSENPTAFRSRKFEPPRVPRRLFSLSHAATAA